MLQFRQPCVQFSLQATLPLKDYPRNTVKNFKRLNQSLDRLDGLLTIHDDMVVYGVGDTEEEAMADHNKNLEQLLQCCTQKGVKLNEKKLKVMCKEWPYVQRVALNLIPTNLKLCATCLSLTTSKL